jgi:hypothetical protein
MSEGRFPKWGFGTVIRVDPAEYLSVPQPDGRRWMVVSFDDCLKWTTLYVGPGSAYAMAGGLIAHWSSMSGFVKVDKGD